MCWGWGLQVIRPVPITAPCYVRSRAAELGRGVELYVGCLSEHACVAARSQATPRRPTSQVDQGASGGRHSLMSHSAGRMEA